MLSAPGASAPIFIVGPPRCGTTLTARLLGNHPGLFAPSETPFFDDIFSRRRQLGDPREPDAAGRIMGRLSTLYGRLGAAEDQDRVDQLLRSEKRPGAFEHYGAALDWFMEIQARAAGARRWVNHVPKDAFYLSSIHAFFPEANIVFCVRDPRAFLASYKHKWRASAPVRSSRHRSLYDPCLTSLLWRWSMQRYEKAARLFHRVHIVRYERLVERPRQSARALAAAVGVPFRPEMLHVSSSNSSFEGGAPGIFPSSVDRWRSRLTPAEIGLCELINADLMVDWGYERATRRSFSLDVARAVLRSPASLGRALWVSRGARAPLVPYLIRRIRR